LKLIPEQYFKDVPEEFCLYLNYVRNSNHVDYPYNDYEFLKKIFKGLLKKLNVDEKEINYEWVIGKDSFFKFIYSIVNSASKKVSPFQKPNSFRRSRMCQAMKKMKINKSKIKLILTNYQVISMTKSKNWQP